MSQHAGRQVDMNTLPLNKNRRSTLKSARIVSDDDGQVSPSTSSGSRTTASTASATSTFDFACISSSECRSPSPTNRTYSVYDTPRLHNLAASPLCLANHLPPSARSQAAGLLSTPTASIRSTPGHHMPMSPSLAMGAWSPLPMTIMPVTLLPFQSHPHVQVCKIPGTEDFWQYDDRSVYFRIQLRRIDGNGIGVRASPGSCNKHLRVDMVLQGGALDAWNATCSWDVSRDAVKIAMVVRKGDIIAEINGTSDSNAMLDHLCEQDEWKIFVFRHGSQPCQGIQHVSF